MFWKVFIPFSLYFTETLVFVFHIQFKWIQSNSRIDSHGITCESQKDCGSTLRNSDWAHVLLGGVCFLILAPHLKSRELLGEMDEVLAVARRCLPCVTFSLTLNAQPPLMAMCVCVCALLSVQYMLEKFKEILACWTQSSYTSENNVFG